MNMLIVAGLMAFGLLAIITAAFLAMDESKTSPTSTTAAAKTSQPTSAPVHATEQRLPALREETQVTTFTTQFSELTAQLRSLHEQAQEVERRLSLLSDLAEQIELGQTRVSIEETQDYRLPEPVNSVHA
jgi:hypothetical protein